MPRTDPTDTGGLFVGRRPGTAPVKYRTPPQRGSGRRRAADNALAAFLLFLEGLICVTFWGPLPVAWLWVGSQVDYQTDSVSLGIFTAFAGLMATLLIGLAGMRRLDEAWILVRRAAGHDQRHGVIGTVFAVTAVVVGVAFSAWFLLFAGASLAPLGISY